MVAPPIESPAQLYEVIMINLEMYSCDLID